MTTRQIEIRCDGAVVDGVLDVPADATAGWVFAHGAGAGMRHGFMERFAAAMAERSVASLRYNFSYMQQGSRRPDAKPLLHATVRGAVEAARAELGGLPLFAGGKSMGGRMTSEAQAGSPLPQVLGIAFIGFPLHPPGKPSTDRAHHLSRVEIPMLFIQGTRDKLAGLDLLEPEIQRLGSLATLHIEDGADHGFHVLKRSGRNDEQVVESMADRLAAWMGEVSGRG